MTEMERATLDICEAAVKKAREAIGRWMRTVPNLPRDDWSETATELDGAATACRFLQQSKR